MARKKSSQEQKSESPSHKIREIITPDNIERIAPEYKFPTAHRFRICPRTDEDIDLIAHDLVLWARQPSSLVFNGFCHVSGLPNSRIYELSKRHQGLANAVELAKQMLSYRREYGALFNELNVQMVLATQGNYDPDLRALRKEMAQKEGQGESKVIVVLDKYPETTEVPEKQNEGRNDSD